MCPIGVTRVGRRAAFPLAAVAVMLVGCGSEQRFSRSKVEQAFARHGVQLVVPDERFDFGQEVVLAPRSGEPFLVLVYTHDGGAKKGISALTSQGSPTSFDRRAANAVVTSDDGLAFATRRRIEAALRTPASSG
jgi:hypothetical protein